MHSYFRFSSLLPFRWFHRLLPVLRFLWHLSRYRFEYTNLHCKAIRPPASYTDALSSWLSSSTSLAVGRKFCNAAASTPVCARRLLVRDEIIGGRLPLMVSFRSGDTIGLPKSVDPSADSGSSCLSTSELTVLPVSPSRVLVTPPTSPVSALAMSTAASSPAPVCRAAQPLSS